MFISKLIMNPDSSKLFIYHTTILTNPKLIVIFCSFPSIVCSRRGARKYLQMTQHASAGVLSCKCWTIPHIHEAFGNLGLSVRPINSHCFHIMGECLYVYRIPNSRVYIPNSRAGLYSKYTGFLIECGTDNPQKNRLLTNDQWKHIETISKLPSQ